jgi:hypothetical protein
LAPPRRSTDAGTKLTKSPRRLFDHLVGAAEQRKRDGEAERLGRREVDEKLNFRGLLDRQVGRLLALENPV